MNNFNIIIERGEEKFLFYFVEFFKVRLVFK